MAIYHLNARIISRGAGRSSVAASAYRAGVKMLDNRTGLIHDYSKRKDVVHSEMVLPYSKELPAWHNDRCALWNHIEAVESSTTRGATAQLAREVGFSLPVELTPAEHITLARSFISKTFVEAGMVADFSIHDKDDGNPHCHVMLSMRELHLNGEFSLKKNRDWNSKALLKDWREAWETEANQALEKGGHSARIDCRTLKEQGEERAAQIHLGVTASSMEKKGKATERGERLRKIKQDNVVYLEQVRRLKAEKLNVEKQIAEEHKVNPVLWLEEVHSKVMANQRLEREAADLGRQSWDWKKMASRYDWQLGKVQEEQGAHLKKFDNLLGEVFKNIEGAKMVLASSEWQNEADAIKDLQKHLTGVSKWLKPKYFVEKDKQKIEVVLKQHQKAKQLQGKLNALQEKAAYAQQEAIKARRLFQGQRAALGTSRQRSNRRAALYGKQTECLRYITSKDIWNSNLPIEQKEELASEWEKHNQRQQVRAVENGRFTAQNKMRLNSQVKPPPQKITKTNQYSNREQASLAVPTNVKLNPSKEKGQGKTPQAVKVQEKATEHKPLVVKHAKAIDEVVESLDEDKPARVAKPPKYNLLEREWKARNQGMNDWINQEPKKPAPLPDIDIDAELAAKHKRMDDWTNNVKKITQQKKSQSKKKLKYNDLENDEGLEY